MRTGILRAVSDDATLSLYDLRLATTPRERSMFERALRFIGLTDELQQDANLLAEECTLDSVGVTAD